ncbi:unnamed protein product, partial [Didymodactylos carnosus]
MDSSSCEDDELDEQLIQHLEECSGLSTQLVVNHAYIAAATQAAAKALNFKHCK